MNGQELRLKRVGARISGRLLCQRAALDRSRLSDIERGYVQPSPDELALISKALEELIKARERVVQFARECGWPITAL
jgi:transcriptional regulator with XRE-family HTH domain